MQTVSIEVQKRDRHDRKEAYTVIRGGAELGFVLRTDRDGLRWRAFRKVNDFRYHDLGEATGMSAKEESLSAVETFSDIVAKE